MTSLDATAKTLVVNGFTIAVTDTTVYGSQGATITAATFWSTVAASVTVEAEGTVSGTTFTATKLTLGGHGGMGDGRH